MKVGILGGTFDPVHWGHIGIAIDARKRFGLEKVLFIPALIPPHKVGREISEPGRRLEMLRLALEPYEEFEYSDIEILRSGRSFTIDTIESLRSASPGDEFFMIIGADNMPDFKSWHRVHDLVGVCAFILVARPEYELDLERALAPDFSPEEIALLGRHILADSFYDIAARDIRRLCEIGQSVRHLVPPPVADYIEQNHLYK